MTAVYGGEASFTAMSDSRAPSVQEDASLGELVGKLGSDLSELMSAHLELAVTEVREDLEQRAKAGGMLAGAAVAALFCLLLLSFAAAWGLAEVIAPGLAFLIVGVVHGLAALVLFVVGRAQMAKASGPKQTVEIVQEDVEWARQQMS